MDERDRWRAFSNDELLVLRCGMMMLKAQPDSPAARAVERMMSESVVALCDQGAMAEGHEKAKASTSLPNAPARLLATDREMLREAAELLVGEDMTAALRVLLTDEKRLSAVLEHLDNKQLGVVLGSALKQLDDRGDSSLSVLLRVLADRVEEAENEGGAA